jgi:alpha-1,2-mannosyltransferase
LGLSIVQAVAQAHHGTASITATAFSPWRAVEVVYDLVCSRYRRPAMGEVDPVGRQRKRFLSVWWNHGSFGDGRVVLLLLGLAFAARIVPVLRGGGLNGLLGYDDGVYFGAADSLLSGRLPYRDFLLLHPPGVLLVLSPFAGLARLVGDPSGLAVARLAFMVVGAVNAVLVFRVASRAGRVAGVAAGVLYAVWPPAAYAERTALLEPLVNLGLLGAAVLLGDVRAVTRRRLLAAGAVLGLAVAVKLWAGLAVLVFAVWLLRRRGVHAAAVFVAAGAAAAALVCLPFFVAAPGTMLRMVVLDQLGRPNNAVATGARLAGVLGRSAASSTAPGSAAVALAVLMQAVALAAAVGVYRACPALRVWVVLLGAQVSLLLAGPAYYDHYATFAAPALTIVLGAAAGLALSAVKGRVPRLMPAVTCVAAVALAAVAVAGLAQPQGRAVPGAQVHRLVASVGCVRADSVAALAEANVLSRDLDRGCPVTVDVTGLTYDQAGARLADGRPGSSRRGDVVWQQYLQRYLAGPGAVLLVQSGADGLGPAARRVLARDRHAVRAGRLSLYLR